MQCNKPDKSAKQTALSQIEAKALYNAIDLQLLKEAPISPSEAKNLILSDSRTIADSDLPYRTALQALDAMNDPSFAVLFLYTFIPDGAEELVKFPEVAKKRIEQIKIVDSIAIKTNVDRSYLQKHLRNVLVSGYGKTPENLIHELSTGKENSDFKGLGWITVALQAVAALAPLFTGGAPSDDWGKNGIQVSTPQGNAVSLIPDWHKAADILFQLPAFKQIAPHLEEYARKGQADSIGNLILSTDPSLFAKIGVPQEALTFLQPLANAPATKDWLGRPISSQKNITGDPAYIAAKPWYKTPLGIFGIVAGTVAVGGTGYALLSNDK